MSRAWPDVYVSAVASMLEAKLYYFNYIIIDLACLAKNHGVVLACPAEHQACHDALTELHQSVVHAYVNLRLVHYLAFYLLPMLKISVYLHYPD